MFRDFFLREVWVGKESTRQREHSEHRVECKKKKKKGDDEILEFPESRGKKKYMYI